MDKKEKIIKMYMSGMPVTQIAEIFSITREAVYQKLRKVAGWKGIKKLQSNYRSSTRLTALQEHSQEIVDKWLSGVNMTDLAKEFKTNRTVISNLIKDARGNTRRMSERDKEIVSLYRDGVTQVELSKRYKISQPCISRIVNTHND